MDFGKLRLFTALTGRMDWLGVRQKVIAQNIANANTPGYQPKDLAEPNFGAQLRTARALRMSATDSSHQGGVAKATSAQEKKVQNAFGATISGNTVDLEAELTKVSETGMQYQTMINLYQKHVALLKTAIGRTG